jgi:hypothetical protein
LESDAMITEAAPRNGFLLERLPAELRRSAGSSAC